MRTLQIARTPNKTHRLAFVEATGELIETHGGGNKSRLRENCTREAAINLAYDLEVDLDIFENGELPEEA